MIISSLRSVTSFPQFAVGDFTHPKQRTLTADSYLVPPAGFVPASNSEVY